MTAGTTATHCPYCSLQCGISLTTAADGGVELTGRDDPINQGGLCRKGASAAELLRHPQRLTTPLVREHGQLRPAGWDEALDRVAAAIRTAQARYGRDAIGCFGGGGLTNEKAYQLGKFARVALRTSQIDYNGRFCMSSAAAAATRAFGVDRGMPFPFADIADADVVLLVGSNPADTMPPAMRHFQAGRERGARHIVVDPRRTATAALAHRHLQSVPHTDLSLANGLLHIAIRDGLVDEAYIADRTSGFDAVRRAVRSDWPDRVERTTGIPVAELTEVVHELAGARTAMILTARGAEQHADGTNTATAWINLALALGLPGRGRGSGYATVTGQGNGQGGREHGQKADQLPGYRKLADPADRAHVAAIWGIDPDELPGPGISAYEMLDRLGTDGGVRVLLLAASNPVVSAPNARHVTERLDALEHLCVADFFLSETARRADVLLPTTQWAEEDGTMTNVEGRILLRRKAFEPPPGVRSDLEILH
ncbi:MAG TPA: molybdopterin-dependent oxidoreductase, partial [Pseudonocardia sp.]|nr:molybdopterin-dependent oxidoreductase [Pseudonocardia sp.]